jgi:23S rRNA pseudouridine955/2504/2580 synthase
MEKRINNPAARIKNIPVLFENDFCFVLNKPAGLSVQGGKGVKVSLDSILSENISPRPHLVHRLDKDTSGIILVAKTREAAGIFSMLYAGRSGKAAFPKTEVLERPRIIVKKYIGVCFGIPIAESGVINLEIDVHGTIKESETSYKLLSRGIADGESVSRLELELGTGRMHQIRRHLAHLGHPLLGDDKYGNFRLNKKLKKTSGLKHLLLHASRLIISPLAGIVPDGLDISAPLPDYFLSLQNRLKQ